MKRPAKESKEARVARAFAEYEKIRDQESVKYYEIRKIAWATFEKIRDQALNRFHEINDPAWVEYKKIIDQALTKYFDIIAQA